MKLDLTNFVPDNLKNTAVLQETAVLKFSTDLLCFKSHLGCLFLLKVLGGGPLESRWFGYVNPLRKLGSEGK